MNKYLIGIIATLVLLLSLSVKYSITQKKEKQRAEDNLKSFADTMFYYKDKNGIISAEKQDLELYISELKSINNNQSQKLLTEAKNNDIATRKIQRLENILSSTNITAQGFKIDTIIKIDTLYQEVEYLHLSDNRWYDIVYTEPKDETIPLSVNVKVYSDLIIINQWHRDGFWLWRWLMRKKEKTTVKDLNPYSTITNFSIVNIKK